MIEPKGEHLVEAVLRRLTWPSRPPDGSLEHAALNLRCSMGEVSVAMAIADVARDYGVTPKVVSVAIGRVSGYRSTLDPSNA